MNAVDVDGGASEVESIPARTPIPIVGNALMTWRVGEVVPVTGDGVEGLEGFLVEDAVWISGAVVAHTFWDEHMSGLRDEARDEPSYGM